MRALLIPVERAKRDQENSRFVFARFRQPGEKP